MKLICVDDDPAILAVLKVSLETVGEHEVLTANSGLDALEKYVNQNAECDCFLLDIQMPEMTGIELCKKIRENPKYDHVPIIMLTAMSDEDYIEDAYRFGATDYVSKPFDPTDLNSRVTTAVSRVAAMNKLRNATGDRLSKGAEDGSVAQSETAQTPNAQTNENVAQPPPAPVVKEVQESSAAAQSTNHNVDPRPRQSDKVASKPQPTTLSALLTESAKKNVKERLNQAPQPNKPVESVQITSSQQTRAYQKSSSPKPKEIELFSARLHRLSDPINIQNHDRVLAHLTFEKYLETMGTHSKREINIFSFGILRIEEIFADLSDRDFEDLLKETASIISGLMKPHRSLFSYFGNGVFCGTIREDGVKYINQLPVLFEQSIKELSVSNSLVKQQALEIKVGQVKPPSLFSSPLTRLKKAAEEMEAEL